MNPSQKLIIRELHRHGDATQKQLTQAIGLAPTTIREYMRILLKNQAIHISGYARTNGGYAYIYRAGSGTNAARPQRIPHAIVNRRYRNNRNGAAIVKMEQSNDPTV